MLMGEVAETEGFEPSIHVATYDDLANRCLQPLGHVSIWVRICAEKGADQPSAAYHIWIGRKMKVS